MARLDDLLTKALQALPPKPDDSAAQADKKRYSEQVSVAVAQAFSQELRHRGMGAARPAPREQGASGVERRMSGGIGAKKVDVTWATEESGLLLGISVKSINFRDGTTGNYQKNLTNRRGDMLFEAVTLHRRFPYAVLAGVFFFDQGAADDGTDRRSPTFVSANHRFKLFSGRTDPAGRDEQYEHVFLVLLDSDGSPPGTRFFAVGEGTPVPIEPTVAFDRLVKTVADRNPDFYEYSNGSIRRTPG